MMATHEVGKIIRAHEPTMDEIDDIERQSGNSMLPACYTSRPD